MKDLSKFLLEELNNVYEGQISSESEFKEYAKKKFKKVFGSELDEDKMNNVVNGILKKYSKEAKRGDWGTLVGVLNKSF